MLVETLVFFVVLVIYKTSGYRNLFISNNREDLNSEIINQISTLLTLETGLVLVTQSAEDYQNVYVNHFLESSEYPLEIAHKSIAWSLVKSKRLDNFIITTTLDALYKNTKTFVMKRGFYFFIIVDNVIVNYNETKAIFQAAWENHRTLHVYLLTYKGGIIAFDPFIYDYASSDYGIVLPLAERKSVEELFTNLNGYPINIEVFRSVYSYLVTGSDGSVIDIRGADAEVAFEIGRQMNFVILLQKPDKFNFGYVLTPSSVVLYSFLQKVLKGTLYLVISPVFDLTEFGRAVDNTLLIRLVVVKIKTKTNLFIFEGLKGSKPTLATRLCKTETTPRGNSKALRLGTGSLLNCSSFWFSPFLVSSELPHTYSTWFLYTAYIVLTMNSAKFSGVANTTC